MPDDGRSRLRRGLAALIGDVGEETKTVERARAQRRVPVEFLKPQGSPRDLKHGEPATVFRYDLVWEFVSAIIEARQAIPSFYEGLNAQIVADAVLESHEKRCWIQISPATR